MLYFDSNITTFSTFAQWYLWNIGLNQWHPHAPDQTIECKELQVFFHRLYQDMYRHPAAYAIPVESYADPAKSNKKRLNVGRIVKPVPPVSAQTKLCGLWWKWSRRCLLPPKSGCLKPRSIIVKKAAMKQDKFFILK